MNRRDKAEAALAAQILPHIAGAFSAPRAEVAAAIKKAAEEQPDGGVSRFAAACAFDYAQAFYVELAARVKGAK